MTDTKLRYYMTIRLAKDEKCFGPGIAQLMEQIADKGSLRAAAMDMGMAYSKAWRILKTAEEQLGFKLIDSTTGGNNGGGAVLTDKGRQLLNEYDTFTAECRKAADAFFPKIFGEY